MNRSPIEMLELRVLLTAYVVDTTADSSTEATDGQISLREAIIASSTNTAYGDAPAGNTAGDLITFASGIDTISLTAGQLVVSDDLRINGDVTIDAGSDSRVFELTTSEKVELRDLSINNAATSGNGAGILVTGGTNLIVENVDLINNVADGNGGAMWVSDDARVNLTNVRFTDNTAANGGGIYNDGGNVYVEFSTFSGNLANADNGLGGGLQSTDGNVSIFRSTFDGNQAHLAGGGVNVDDGELSLRFVTLENNIAGTFVDAEPDAPETSIQTYTADLQTLNAAYGSTASGTATLILDTTNVTGDNSGTATLRVQIDASGLEDLTSIPGAVHVGHIHGQFAGNATRPIAEQGNGPFFEGEGGDAVDSVLPSAEEDGERNIDETELFGDTYSTDFLEVSEGRTKYGPVVLNLTQNQIDSAPSGTDPLTYFFQLAGMGDVNPANEFPNGTEFNLDTTYTFDLSDDDARRQFNNLVDLDKREIVLHGMTVPTEISDAIDDAAGVPTSSPAHGVPLGDGTSFRATAPVAAGEIVMVNDDENGDDNGTGDDMVLQGPGNGGGLHVGGDANVTVFKNRVTANHAASEGGGLWNSAGGTMFVTGTLIEDNVASGDEAINGGGGIYNDGGNLTVEFTTIEDNVADGTSGSGGGILNNNGEVSANYAILQRNISNRAGGGIESVGGEFNFRRGDLRENVAGPEGSANPGNGGGVHTSGGADFDFFKSFAFRNTAALEGGALWNGGNMDIQGSAIQSNFAFGDDADTGGGGVFNNGGDVYIGYTTIFRNEASGTAGSGGGIFSTDGNVTVNFSNVRNNVANRAGGGIEIINGDLKLTTMTLRNNTAGPEGSASPGNGGGLHVTGNDATVLVSRSGVRNNIAASEGGGLWNQAGTTMTVEGTALTNNLALGNDPSEGGAAIFNNGGDLVVKTGTQILRNETNGSGGGIHNIEGGNVSFSDSYIGRNAADLFGGGIYNDGDAELDSGAMYFNFAADDGGGIFTDAGATTDVDGTDIRLNQPNNFAGPGTVS